MSRFNTGNPLGSGSPLDLDDNAKNMDEAANSSADTFQDRLGKSRLTWAGIVKAGSGDPSIAVDAAARANEAAGRAEDAEANVEQNAEQIAQNAAEQAVQDVVADVDGQVAVAQSAADRAETAAEVAMAAGWVYATAAEGEAVRADGEYFWVVSAGDSEVLELWRMGASSATDTGKRTISGEYTKSRFQRLGFITTERGRATLLGATAHAQNIDYEASDYIPVRGGDTVYFTGVSSWNNPVKGFDQGKNFVADLFVSIGDRSYTYRQPITIPDGVCYITASSAFNNSANANFPKSPLILENVNLVQRVSEIVDDFAPRIRIGFATLGGLNGPYEQSIDYEASDYIPVSEGDVVTYTGVSSPTNPVKGFDSSFNWVQDIFVTTAERQHAHDQEITIPAGVSYIVACSAVGNKYVSRSPTSRLILKVNGYDALNSLTKDDKILHRSKRPGTYDIRGELVLGEGLATGGTNFYDVGALSYHRTGFIPVIEGEKIYYTGVTSGGNGAVKAFDESKVWLQDLFIATANRQLNEDVEIVIPQGVKYIMACSSYTVTTPVPTDYSYHPLVLEREFLAIADLVERGVSPQTSPTETLTKFRTMAYNIWIGGRDATGRDAVLKHIARTYPDIISIQEAGAVSVIKPLLEGLGFKYFYGAGGDYGLYFASKYRITFSTTFNSVDWTRKPLYTEVNINGKTVGIVSIHLDSNCTVNCHYPDYLNVAPQEPSAQKRCIQMYQIMAELNERKAQNPELSGFIVQGDYNAIYNQLNVLEYATPLDETSLPAGLSYPLSNAQFPTKQFAFYNGTMNLITKGSANGDNITWWGPPESPNPVPAEHNFEHRLDYIAYSDNIKLDKSEVLNSVSDNALPDAGIRKYGEALNTDDGYIASDHIPVVADFIIP